MDNQKPNPENAWVDSKLANLVPPEDWYPDSKHAFAQFLKRRDSKDPATSSSWVRLSMAAAILASIGVVVALLPWQALWKPTAQSKGKASEPVKAATPAPPAFVAIQQPALPATKQEQKLAGNPGSGETPHGIIGPVIEPNSTDEARRAHILGTVAALQESPTPAPGQGQAPVEHIGPGVTAPRPIPPIPQPDYTDEARREHIQGTVILGVIVRVDGTGKVEQVIQSLDPGLDQKAIEIFEKWRFTPAMKDGKPVDFQMHVTISFHLY